MKTGPIRLLRGDSSRFLASRRSPVLVERIGTALPGPALTSGPGAFFSNDGFVGAAARNDPALSYLHFHFMRWMFAGRMRGEDHEQGIVV